MSFFVHALASAAAQAAPTMERYGLPKSDFLEQLTESLHGLGLETGMAAGIKPLGKHGDGREDEAQAFVPSPAAGAALLAAQEIAR